MATARHSPLFPLFPFLSQLTPGLTISAARRVRGGGEEEECGYLRWWSITSERNEDTPKRGGRGVGATEKEEKEVGETFLSFLSSFCCRRRFTPRCREPASMLVVLL